ncbi:hypothetical protein C8J57DRAFT_1538273 [Mycena rebaudengoi]|nr:hypothetical protein C8J57DRAFT_1538273 [Mycena rebaudengoi]
MGRAKVCAVLPDALRLPHHARRGTLLRIQARRRWDRCMCLTSSPFWIFASNEERTSIQPPIPTLLPHTISPSSTQPHSSSIPIVSSLPPFFFLPSSCPLPPSFHPLGALLTPISVTAPATPPRDMLPARLLLPHVPPTSHAPTPLPIPHTPPTPPHHPSSSSSPSAPSSPALTISPPVHTSFFHS